MKAWKLYDGDHHLIAAKTEEEAQAFYCRHVSLDPEEPATVQGEVSPETAIGSGDEAVTVAELLDGLDEPALLASTL